MTIDTAKIKNTTKGLLALVFSGSALFTDRDVQFYLLRRVIKHPQLTALLLASFGAAALLHNPKVMDVLGIKETLTVEKVAVDPEAKP